MNSIAILFYFVLLNVVVRADWLNEVKEAAKEAAKEIVAAAREFPNQNLCAILWDGWAGFPPAIPGESQSK